MKTNNKGFGEILVILGIAIVVIIVIAVFIGGSGDDSTVVKPTENQAAADVQKKLITDVPLPQLEHSLERENVSRRAQIFNTPDKVSYIYLVSYGKVMAFYSVRGKVSSLQSYMVPTEKLLNADGKTCSNWDDGSNGSCYIVAAPDIDGTYGENVEGIFFFTTEDAYVEWKGEYMMSDQPLKLSTPPALIREIQ